MRPIQIGSRKESGSKTGIPCFSASARGVRNQTSSSGSSLWVKRADTEILLSSRTSRQAYPISW